MPEYDFEKTRRAGYEEYIPDERDILVFEGIQAVYPEITRLFAPGTKRVGALIRGRDYYVRVDAFNENGITAGKCVKL